MQPPRCNFTTDTGIVLKIFTGSNHDEHSADDCNWVERLFPDTTDAQIEPLLNVFGLYNYVRGEGCFGNNARRFARPLETELYVSPTTIINDQKYVAKRRTVRTPRRGHQLVM